MTAADRLERESNIVKIMRELRQTKQALRIVLTKDQRKRLRKRLKQIAIDDNTETRELSDSDFSEGTDEDVKASVMHLGEEDNEFGKKPSMNTSEAPMFNTNDGKAVTRVDTGGRSKVHPNGGSFKIHENEISEDFVEGNKVLPAYFGKNNEEIERTPSQQFNYHPDSQPNDSKQV